eukprot:scaffold17415_cov101-Skeletonema_dohrnii-CCMP3373.AAC.3
MDRLLQLPFIYRGVPPPRDITSARIHPSIDTIAAGAFAGCENLTDVEVHEGVRKIELNAFNGCKSLTGLNFQRITIIETQAFAFCTSIRRIKLPAIITIEQFAFTRCRNLTDVEIGTDLGTIEQGAFIGCTSLRRLRLGSATNIKQNAFRDCEYLTEFIAPLELERIENLAFGGCNRLVHIRIPLNDRLFGPSYNAFNRCQRLASAELVGDIHETVSKLGLPSWQNTMKDKIESINGLLHPEGPEGKTMTLFIWLQHVQVDIDYYKLEHNNLLKESMSLLELALWKIKLDEKEESMLEVPTTKKAKIGRKQKKTMRAQCRQECNATVVIENVLPFLYKFKDV